MTITTIMKKKKRPEPRTAKAETAKTGHAAQTGETDRAPPASADTCNEGGMEPKHKQFIVVYNGRGPSVCGRPPMGGMVGGLR